MKERVTEVEWENLRSQFTTSSEAWGGRRSLPYVFTEYGAVMPAGGIGKLEFTPKNEVTKPISKLQLTRTQPRVRMGHEKYDRLRPRKSAIQHGFD
jgi:hypothetical protein